MAASEKTKWETLEEYLFDHDKDGTDFSVAEYANEVSVDKAIASSHIQAYLGAQRRGDKDATLYVLHRVAGSRTRSARWLVGTRTKDARQIGAAFYDDVTTRVRRALAPDLRRIAMINPRAAKAAEAQITGVIEGAMKVLEAAAKGTLVS